MNSPAKNIFSLSLSEGTTLLVGKLTEFKGKKLLKLANIATVKQEGGQKFLETLSGVAKTQMSSAMKVDGPGIYGIYMTKNPVAFVSGQVTLGGHPAGNSLIIATAAPFVSLSSADGGYSIATFPGQGGLAGYDLASGAFGEVYLPVEKPCSVNPKTGEAPLTPATEKPISNIDALNLVG